MKEKSRISLPSANNPWTLLRSLLKQKVTKSRTHKRHLLLSILLVFGSLFLSTGASYAGEGYVGAWREGSDNYAMYGYDSWDRFTKKWEELGKGNLRLVDMEVRRIGNKTHFLGVWRKGSDGYVLYGIDGWDKFTKKWEELAQKNLRLVDVEVEKIGNKTFHYGIWREGSDNYSLYRYDSWGEFTKKWEELAQQNLRLVDIEVEKIGSKTFYYGVWRKGSDAYALYRYDSWSEFTKKWKELGQKNLRLIDVEPVKIGDKTHYFGVWRTGSEKHALYRFKNWDNFTKKWKELAQQNLRLVDIGVFETSSSVASGNNSSNSDSSDYPFPTLPDYIKLKGTRGRGSYRVVVDFSNTIDGNPTITLPANFLSILPTYNGEVIFPDNFCGMRFIVPSRFMWLDSQNKVVDEHPYNYVPESSSVDKMFGSNYYLGGIEFTGPMSSGCSKPKGQAFDFPFPLTKEGENPFPGLKLVIELQSDSQIKFLNYDVSRELLKVDEIFKEKSFNKVLTVIDEMLNEIYEENEENKKLENYQKFVDEVCSIDPQKCPRKPLPTVPIPPSN